MIELIDPSTIRHSYTLFQHLAFKMAAPATPANRLPATLATARTMSTVGIELDLISPFVPRPNTYGYDLEALYASPYQSPRWVTYWRGAWDNVCRRLETKSKNQLMCDVMALFTGIPQEQQLINTRGGVRRLPDFMVESDLSAYHADDSPALKHTETAQAVSRWRESEESESNVSMGIFHGSLQLIPLDPSSCWKLWDSNAIRHFLVPETRTRAAHGPFPLSE